nr:type II toxin-antitoxin system RelE/ParE family toxin [uncultured Arthrobacter sp.]
MKYRIELRPAAVCALKRIGQQDRDRRRGAIALLATDPRPPEATPLQGRAGLRARVGNYCLMYTVDDNVVVVAKITPGHRSDVYWC